MEEDEEDIGSLIQSQFQPGGVRPYLSSPLLTSPLLNPLLTTLLTPGEAEQGGHGAERDECGGGGGGAGWWRGRGGGGEHTAQVLLLPPPSSLHF